MRTKHCSWCTITQHPICPACEEPLHGQAFMSVIARGFNPPKRVYFHTSCYEGIDYRDGSSSRCFLRKVRKIIAGDDYDGF